MSSAYWTGVGDGTRGSSSPPNNSWDNADYLRGQQAAKDARDRAEQEQRRFKENMDRWMRIDPIPPQQSYFSEQSYLNNNDSYPETSTQVSDSYTPQHSFRPYVRTPIEDEDFNTRYEHYKKHDFHVARGAYETMAHRQFEERYRIDKEQREKQLKTVASKYSPQVQQDLKSLTFIDYNTSISHEERLRNSQIHYRNQVLFLTFLISVAIIAFFFFII